MPEYAIKIAHIFPTYYFVLNNESIKTIEIFNFENIKGLLTNGGIIIAYSLAFIVLTNYITKKINFKEEKML